MVRMNYGDSSLRDHRSLRFYGEGWLLVELLTWKRDKYRFLKSYQLLENEPPGRILDVGCLAGGAMLPLMKAGWECYGVELSDSYKVALERGVKCVRHNVEEGLPFEDCFFDVVWAEEILEHVLDTDFLLSEVYRVLKPRGVLILSTPNIASLTNRLKLLLGKYPDHLQYSNNGVGHVRYYTASVLLSQLSRHGFSVEKLTGNFLPAPKPLMREPFKRLVLSPLGNLLPTLSDVLIVKARKKR
ncbi:MAG: class I SAM-dependent methyltransferase [Candidatus Jordarchaeales archaeon]